MATRKKKQKRSGGGLMKKIYSFGQFNLTLISFALAAVGQSFIYFGRHPVIGSVFFALAVVVFLLADAARKQEPLDRLSDTLDPRIEVALFLAVVAVAIFFRVYEISGIPAGCYRDEGQNGNEAINIMKGIAVDGTSLPVYIERWTQNAAMYMYFIAASFKAFGIGVLQIRLVSIVFGVLCIPAFYFLVRHLMGPRTALVGAFLMAVSRWHVNFSRVGFLGIVTVFFVVLCLYSAYRAYRYRKPFDFIMLGVLTGLSLYTYLAARLIPVGFVIFMAYLLFREFRFYKANWKNLLLTVAATVVVLLPLLQYALKHPANFTSRQSTVSIFNQEMLHEIGGRYTEKDGTPKHWVKLYLDSLWRTAFMFNYAGDGNPRHNLPGKPMLDFFTGIFYVLGFFYALYNWLKPRYFLLLAMFFAFLQAGLLSTESPQAYRTIAEIPVVLLFAAVFIERLFAYAREQYGKQAVLNVSIAVGAALTLSAWENYRIYFDQWAKTPGAWAEFSTDEYNMGKFVHSLGEDYVAVVRPDWVESYTFRFATYPYDNFRHFNLADWVPIREKEKKNYVYVLDSSYLPLVSILKNMYPEGKYGEFRHKYIPGNLLYFTYEVPYESVKRYQEKPSVNGLTGRYYRGIEWSGNPAITRVDPFILFNWTIDPVMGKYSVKWTGRIRIDKPGRYRFITDSNDFSDVAIDGKTVVVNPGQEKGGPKGTGEVVLARGMHSLQVRYYESIHYSRMQFWWQPPYAESQEVVPSEVLFPN